MSTLYKKNGAEELDPALFADPSCEYRAGPFWSWNCELSTDQLDRQIDAFKEMGFGGFQMHSRTGMKTTYLGEKFMAAVRHCTDRAKAEQMLAWLYDEDRWPSGSAGGTVTKNNPELRSRDLMMATWDIKESTDDAEAAYHAGEQYFVGAYEVRLNENRQMIEYHHVARDAKPHDGTFINYFYCRVGDPGGWMNNSTNTDHLSPEPTDEFIRRTHEKYAQTVGDEFDKCVPAIFFDEPGFTDCGRLREANGQEWLGATWCYGFEKGFQETYGEDIIACLPELFWELPDGRVSTVRYHYHDYCAKRFSENFVDRIADWCHAHNLACTGHFLFEEDMCSSVQVNGDLMRHYRHMDIPGMDILNKDTQLTTAVQMRSVAHQFGKEGSLAELYGVTNWDFDFRGHKNIGDWLAAAGVTVRVPHLSYLSMAGEAKRDYPASINYQSPWYKQYSYIENHFARLNTALTRGKPVVKVGIIYPVESFWIYYGPICQTGEITKEMTRQYEETLTWAFRGHHDADLICEALLPEEWSENAPKTFGCMPYDTIVVTAAQKTMRATTLAALKGFQKAGGRVIFMGDCPKLVDAKPSDAVQALYAEANVIPHSQIALSRALAADTMIQITDVNSSENADDLIYQWRADKHCQWLFICRFDPLENVDICGQRRCRITLNGRFRPEWYDTLTGEIHPVAYEIENGKTMLIVNMDCSTSWLFRLTDAAEDGVFPLPEAPKLTDVRTFDFRGPQEYTLEEPNVVLLDLAEYAYDDGDFQSEEEVIRIHDGYKKALGYQNNGCQPWAMPPAPPATHTLTLRYTIDSTIDVPEMEVAFENVADNTITLNGNPVKIERTGYYIDESFEKIRLPGFRKGRNVLVLKKPFTTDTTVEAGYLLGDFGVKLQGSKATVIPRDPQLGWGSIVAQGLPFYGGNLTYHSHFTLEETAALSLKAHFYRGALLRVALDGKDKGVIAFAPYTIELPDVAAGEHTLDIKLFGNRFNTLAALHNCNRSGWTGTPDRWRGTGDCWDYGYAQLTETGVMASPTITVRKKEQ